MKNKIISVLYYTVIIILYGQSTFSVKKDSKLDACNIDTVNIDVSEKAVILTGAFQHTESDDDLTRTMVSMERTNTSNVMTETPYPTNETWMFPTYGYTNATTDENPVTFSYIENNKVQDVVNDIDCSIDLIAMDAYSMVIDVSFSYSHSLYSYLYIENLIGRNEQCPKTFVLFSITVTPVGYC